MLRVGGGCLLSICGLRVLPARGCCWGQQDDGASGPAHQPISVPTVTPQRDPSQKGGLPKPDLLERQGLMPMDRCGDWAGLRQLFQRSLARRGRPPPHHEKSSPLSTRSPRHVGNVPPSNSSPHQSPRVHSKNIWPVSPHPSLPRSLPTSLLQSQAPASGLRPWKGG